MKLGLKLVRCKQNTLFVAVEVEMNNWWPVSDEEWEQLNFPKKQPTK
jgi:hypothetical protein